MERRRWTRGLGFCAVVVLVSACSGVELRRPMIAYDFDNPILNERWIGAHNDPLPPARSNPSPPPVVAESKPASEPESKPASEPVLAQTSPAPAAPVSPRGNAAKPLPIATAAEQVVLDKKEAWEDPPKSPDVAVALPPIPGSPVPDSPSPTPDSPSPTPEPRSPTPPAASASTSETSPEIASAAGRLVGIRSSFDQDSFLKHVLFVSNVTLDDAPTEGLVRWVWKRFGKGGGRTLEPGHLVFLGWGDRARIVGVVESVDEHGTAHFITINADEVKRLTITPGKPRARRDERSGRILNSAVGKGRLAGETLMGVVRVIPDARGNAGLATAD